jgi:glycosyltransferase involved in cell wall biosynthesis
MVRVAYVDHTAQFGGAEIALMGLLKELDRPRWEPIVSLGSVGPLVNWLMANGINVEVLHLPAGLSGVRQANISTGRTALSPLRLKAIVQYSLSLARFFRQNGVGLVHANSLRSCILGGIAGRLAHIPVVWQVHSVVAEPMVSKQGVQLMQWLARWLPRHVICNSAATAAVFGLRPAAVSVVPCGVDLNRLVPHGQQMVRSTQRIGMVSRLSPIKGQHVFLQAAHQVGEQYRSARFVLAGSALFGEHAYEAKIREDAGKGVLAGRVEMLGFVTDVPELIRTLDIVVQPSTAPEGFGQILVEAMLCAKPVIASAAGGSAELIEDGITGRLVQPGDATALAEAITDVLSHPAEAAEMGKRARQVALDRYDIRKTTRAIEGVYERVLAKV